MQNSKSASQKTFVDDHVNPVSPITLIATSPVKRIRLWDLPTRIFHWSLVLLVAIAVVSGETGGEWMGVHAKAGIAIIGLITFRLIWGVTGSTYARFAHFTPAPSELLAYFKGEWKGVGHNPLGALSVFALLALLAAQSSTGLFSNDDIDFTGPLFNLVDQGLSNKITGFHQILAKALFVLLAVHIVAIIFYTLVKKDNLVKPMITGWKEVKEGKSAVKGGIIAFSVALFFSLAAVYAVSDFTLRDAFSSTAQLPAAPQKITPSVPVNVPPAPHPKPSW